MLRAKAISVVLGLVVVMWGGAPVFAQEEAPAQPPLLEEEKAEPGFRFGFIFGASSGQFDSDWGPSGAAVLDLTIQPEDPLLGQRISGEILLGYSHNKRKFDVVTSALLGPEFDVTLQCDTLTIFAGINYSIETLSESFKPYLVFGPGMYVEMVKARTGRVLGQVPLAPELANRHYPDSWAELEVGVQVGGGFHWDLSDALYVGIDARFNFLGDKNNDFGTVGVSLGLRF